MWRNQKADYMDKSKEENVQTIWLNFRLELQGRKCKYANFSLILEETNGYCPKK